MPALAACTAVQGPDGEPGTHLLSGSARVIDGDTIDLAGERVRLFGIDAPELAQRCGNERREPCGSRAAAALAALIGNRPVSCRWSTRDRYGRIVATCHAGGRDLGGEMVARGWAIAYRSYSELYVAKEDEAKWARLGLWRSPFQPPATYRAQSRGIAPPQAPPSQGCAIKGNISRSGARIYHLPGAPGYASVRIDRDQGERWFCSVDEAQAAGWRARR